MIMSAPYFWAWSNKGVGVGGGVAVTRIFSLTIVMAARPNARCNGVAIEAVAPRVATKKLPTPTPTPNGRMPLSHRLRLGRRPWAPRLHHLADS